jgi:hypothetical protein
MNCNIYRLQCYFFMATRGIEIYVYVTIFFVLLERLTAMERMNPILA